MSEKIIMRVVLRAILSVVVIAFLLLLAWAVRSVLILILVSSVFAVGLSPVVDAISGLRPERRFLRLPRVVATLVLYSALFIATTLAAVAVIPPLVDQAEELAFKMPQYVEGARGYLVDLETTYPTLSGIDAWLEAQGKEAFKGIDDVSSQLTRMLRLAISVVNGVFTALLLLVFTFYLLIDGGELANRLFRFLPAESRGRAVLVADRVRVRIGNWLLGQVFLSMAVGFATFVGLRLLGIPYSLFLAVIAAIGEVIPMVGPIVAAVPAVIVAAQASPTLGVLTAGLYIAIQQLENHVLVPQVMRRAIELPPVVVLTALLIGNEILGIVGAIIALPIAAALSVMAGELLAMRSGQDDSSPERRDHALSGARATDGVGR